MVCQFLYQISLILFRQNNVYFSQFYIFSAYFPIAVLPKTARSIKIKENALSSNYLSIRDIFGKYLLNGEHRVAWPGEYKIGGAKFYYSRPYNEPETLTCDGPLTEDLVLEVNYVK